MKASEIGGVFYSLCFAICSSQTTYQSNKKVNERLRSISFLERGLGQTELEILLKPVRFYKNKAKWLLEMRSNYKSIRHLFIHMTFIGPFAKRDILIKNIKGLGMKTASMFLRDIGYDGLAIIDTHILKYLNAPAPKNKKEYLKLEERFCKIATKKNMRPGELDTRVWTAYSKSYQKGG